MKSKELKKYNLPEDRILLGIIDAKPNAILFVSFFIGLIFLLFKQYVWGAIICGYAMMLMTFLPGKVLVEFYEEYLVLYNHANKNDCDMIYYDEVVKWRYNYGISYDELTITLIDDSNRSVDGFSRVEYETKMNRFLKDKKDKTKKLKKERVS
ncbi:MAG: hypothetical protein Q4B60_08695 [Erysipelotrichaceae bacterium]|nr:hypothetical protein [Erysipelotrichaceae bacterium]